MTSMAILLKVLALLNQDIFLSFSLKVGLGNLRKTYTQR